MSNIKKELSIIKRIDKIIKDYEKDNKENKK